VLDGVEQRGSPITFIFSDKSGILFLGRTNRGVATVMLVEFFPSLTGMGERIRLFTLELVIDAHIDNNHEYSPPSSSAADFEG